MKLPPLKLWQVLAFVLASMVAGAAQVWPFQTNSTSAPFTWRMGTKIRHGTGAFTYGRLPKRTPLTLNLPPSTAFATIP